MIFRRRKRREAEETWPEAVSEEVSETATPEQDEADESPADDSGDPTTDAGPAGDHESDDGPDSDDGPGGGEGDGDEESVPEPDLAELDAREWRADGPYDITEVDLDEEDDSRSRIDLGSMIITGVEGAELRLQVADETQQIVSAMLITKDSALELGAFAAPRSGGLWPELREELVEAASEAGGSSALVEGPFGVELRRLLPVQTPDGEQGYQPSRMWVAEGPRWLLRGIVYGQAALLEGVESPVAELLDCFRSTVVRRGDEARAPGDLLPLTLPQAVATADTPEGESGPHQGSDPGSSEQ